MRNILGSAMVGTMALSLFFAVTLFGGSGMNWAAPAMWLGLIAALLWGAKLLTSQRVSWKHAPTHGPVVVFWMYTVVRYATSSLEFDSRMELIQVTFYTLAYFTVANNLYHSRDRLVLVFTLSILAVVQSAYGIWQAATGSDMVFALSRPEYYHGRGSGTFICPNHMAGFLEMTLGILIARAAFFHGKRRGVSDRNLLGKILLLYAAIMALAGILASFSRGGWGATLAALLALLLWTESRLRTTWQRVAVGSAVLVALLAAILIVPKAWNHMNRALVPDQTGGGRTLMWYGAVQSIKSAPVFGTGPGTWQWHHQLHRHPDLQIHPIYAHSDTLQLWSDYGLVGWLIVLAFFVALFWHVALLTTRKTSSEPRSLAIGISVAMIAILAHSWGDFNLHIPANALLLAILAGYLAALDDPKNRYSRVPLQPGPRIALGLAVVFLSLGGLWFGTRAALATHAIAKGDDAREDLDWDAAEARFLQALRFDSKHADPYFKLGEVYRLRAVWRIDPSKRDERIGFARQAIEYYQRALELNPFQTQTLSRLSHAYEILGETDRARETLERALTVDPRSAFVYLRLGILYRRLGDDAKAAQAFQTSEQLNAIGDEISRFQLEDIERR